MFASRTRKEVVITGDSSSGQQLDDVTVTVRKLSAKELEEARDARQLLVAKTIRGYGPEIMNAMSGARPDKPVAVESPTLEAKAAARYGAFDRRVILRLGVVSWDATDEKGVAIKVTDTNSVGIPYLDDLDEPASDKLFHAIIDLSVLPEDSATTSKG